MKIAYDIRNLLNLQIVKDATNWNKSGFISDGQLTAIKSNCPSNLYHPNLMIRILLFVATCIAISGANGLFLIFIMEASDSVQGVLAIAAGSVTLYLAQMGFVNKNHHYRSGVVEAVVYYASCYLIVGFSLLTNWNIHLILIATVAALAYVSIRFLDLICTILGVLVLAGLIFYECYELGGIFQQIIPFAIIGSFSLIYWLAKGARKSEQNALWNGNLMVIELLSLLLIYSGGNYFVVRECSILLLNLTIETGGDIPFAFIFYTLTALVPLVLLFRGIQLRNLNMARLGVLTIVLSVITFRYYYSVVPPEIALTIAGIIVLGIAAYLFNFLKVPRNGFTREKLLHGNWPGENAMGFAISQTMGGNVAKPDDSFKGGGGNFGGGGASGDF
jgi:uncharacterized membrane protein YgcG